MAVLCQKFATGEKDVALIQQPWVYGDWIRELYNIRGMLFSAGPDFNLRILIFVRHTDHIFLLLEICSRVMATVRRTYTRGGNKREIIISSAYFTPTTIKPPCERGCSSSFDVMLTLTHETACTLEHHAHTRTSCSQMIRQNLYELRYIKNFKCTFS
jgi:hypothetical protein